MEDGLHELPFWRVANFVWMIAWGWESHMGMIVPNIFHILCLKKASRPHIVVSMDVPLFHDESHLDFSPKGCFYTWEEQIENTLMRKYPFFWRNLSLRDAIGGRGEALQFYPCSCLRESNIWGGGL